MKKKGDEEELQGENQMLLDFTVLFHPSFEADSGPVPYSCNLQYPTYFLGVDLPYSKKQHLNPWIKFLSLNGFTRLKISSKMYTSDFISFLSDPRPNYSLDTCIDLVTNPTNLRAVCFTTVIEFVWR